MLLLWAQVVIVNCYSPVGVTNNVVSVYITVLYIKLGLLTILDNQNLKKRKMQIFLLGWVDMNPTLKRINNSDWFNLKHTIEPKKLSRVITQKTPTLSKYAFKNHKIV